MLSHFPLPGWAAHVKAPSPAPCASSVLGGVLLLVSVPGMALSMQDDVTTGLGCVREQQLPQSGGRLECASLAHIGDALLHHQTGIRLAGFQVFLPFQPLPGACCVALELGLLLLLTEHRLVLPLHLEPPVTTSPGPSFLWYLSTSDSVS